ncbi:MAG TPA: YebC/PmpR family DNA-binding transcriptional regulator [Patescibacteria group bacterium]|jgi:YebC/PmpR family DNA-binding regulatory protein|nr:YebC/PmpR family DNA-binding transcriptional regulator [Patescibacteria group bacterium]
MSGHSKWSTIKHKKAAVDAKRGKVFTRLAKEVTLAAREGGGDPSTNVRLRLAVDKAKAGNMPKDNIERAIKRGTGEIEGGELEEIIYEGYAPHGVGILIEVVTDNRNRAIAEVRHAFNKQGGSMAESGAVVWQFSRKGYISITEEFEQDEVFLTAADGGADDVRFEESMAEVFTDLEDLQNVRIALEESGYALNEVSVIYEPSNTIELETSAALQVMKLVESLEDLDDVQNVYSALEISDEAMLALAAV